MVTSPASILRSDPGYRFDFCGGELAIDFTNTGSRGADSVDHLRTFGDLMAWAEARTVVTPEQARRLRRTAGQRPPAARAALASALELREALYRVITAAAGNRTAADADLAILNAHVRRTFSRMRLTPARARLELTMDDGPPASLADAVLTPIVRAAVDLLTSDGIARVRQCADASCAWLFLDTTRNRTRRWCDMKACGNRSKVRRFRVRNPDSP
jgi:predicted RNA-binding Zn ribbon-like protein